MDLKEQWLHFCSERKSQTYQQTRTKQQLVLENESEKRIVMKQESRYRQIWVKSGTWVRSRLRLRKRLKNSAVSNSQIGVKYGLLDVWRRNEVNLSLPRIGVWATKNRAQKNRPETDACCDTRRNDTKVQETRNKNIFERTYTIVGAIHGSSAIIFQANMGVACGRNCVQSTTLFSDWEQVDNSSHCEKWLCPVSFRHETLGRGRGGLRLLDDGFDHGEVIWYREFLAFPMKQVESNAFPRAHTTVWKRVYLWNIGEVIDYSEIPTSPWILDGFDGAEKSVQQFSICLSDPVQCNSF